MTRDKREGTRREEAVDLLWRPQGVLALHSSACLQPVAIILLFLKLLHYHDGKVFENQSINRFVPEHGGLASRAHLRLPGAPTTAFPRFEAEQYGCTRVLEYCKGSLMTIMTMSLCPWRLVHAEITGASAFTQTGC